MVFSRACAIFLSVSLLVLSVASVANAGTGSQQLSYTSFASSQTASFAQRSPSVPFSPDELYILFEKAEIEEDEQHDRDFFTIASTHLADLPGISETSSKDTDRRINVTARTGLGSRAPPASRI